MPGPHRRRDGSARRRVGRPSHRLRHGESRGPRNGLAGHPAGRETRRQIRRLSTLEYAPMNRRPFLALLALGLLKPWSALAAAWNKDAFGAKSVADALKSLGAAAPAPSKDLVIEAPQIAENGM